MPQFSNIADAVNVTPCHPSRLGAHGARVAVFIGASVLTVLFAGGAANGQTPFSPGPAQSTAQSGAQGTAQPTTGLDSGAGTTTGLDSSAGTTTGLDSGAATTTDNEQSSSTSAANLASVSLSSSQIIDILQRNPDLVLEIKSQVADRMQEQGTQIDANDISDQMLYAQISSNAGLRANSRQWHPALTLVKTPARSAPSRRVAT
jgi:hypothetical protein